MAADARALLDALMGTNRDVKKDKADGPCSREGHRDGGQGTVGAPQRRYSQAVLFRVLLRVSLSEIQCLGYFSLVQGV